MRELLDCQRAERVASANPAVAIVFLRSEYAVLDALIAILRVALMVASFTASGAFLLGAVGSAVAGYSGVFIATHAVGVTENGRLVALFRNEWAARACAARLSAI